MGQWSKLSAKEKAQIIKFSIDNGVSDIDNIRDTYNVYADGGSIRIDKNKRGTFTAAATKYGKSVQEFARQILANKENYSHAMVRKAVFAHNSAKWHKHAGDSEESSYLRTKEGSAHPFIYSMLSSSMGQADNPMLTAINMLVNKYSKEPIVYTGSFYFGDKYGYGTEKKVPTNRNLIDLYVNGNEENFKRIYNPIPIVLDGDTLNYRQYEGTILPQDTIYLRPESKSTISRMTESKALLPINNSYPGFMSYSQKYNFLDSPYFLDKYYGKTIDDVNNAQMSFKKDTKGNYYADVFDLWDLKGTDSLGIGNYIENQLATDTIENNGPFIIRQKVPIVFNRDSVSDGNFLNTISAKRWEKELDKDKHSTGGPLYPFSFQKNPYLKVPAVRYGKGGKKSIPSKVQIVRSVWDNENPFNKGLLKNGMYEQYDDPNGEGRDVGPGLLVGVTIPDKKLYTRQELDDAAYAFGMEGLASIGKAYNEKYGTENFPTPFDTVSVAPKLLLLDTRYQNGRLPIANWPSLYQSIADGNWAEALKNSRSTYIKDGVKHYDNDRVRRRAESIFPGMFDVIFTPDSKEFPKVISRKKSKK